MSQAADRMASTGYLRVSDEVMPDIAATALFLSHAPRPARAARGAARPAVQIEPLMAALRIEHQIRGRLRHLLGSHQEVSDLLQDVYLQLLIAGDRPPPEIESIAAYVMTVARNKAFDWLRRKKTAATLCPTIDIDDVDVLPAEGMRPDELSSSEEELEALFAAIGALPQRCQQVFVLCKVYGMSHKRIARVVGIAVHTVEQHMRRAMRLLGQSLERHTPGQTLICAVRKSVTRFRAGGKKVRWDDRHHG